MAVNKKDREIIFNKFGGRCAYCGEELVKGWHVDEIEPCIRINKTIKARWSDGWNRNMTEEEISAAGIYWINEKTVFDRYEFPERVHIDNQYPACASCNIMKNRDTLEGFRSQIKQFVKSLNAYINQYKFAKRYGLVSETGEDVKFYFEKINGSK